MMPQQYGCCNRDWVIHDGRDGTTRYRAVCRVVDLTTWGVGEYAVLAVGAFVLYSMFDTGRRGVGDGARTKKIKRGFTS